jgi:hypothetical protein
MCAVAHLIASIVSKELLVYGHRFKSHFCHFYLFFLFIHKNLKKYIKCLDPKNMLISLLVTFWKKSQNMLNVYFSFHNYHCYYYHYFFSFIIIIISN